MGMRRTCRLHTEILHTNPNLIYVIDHVFRIINLILHETCMKIFGTKLIKYVFE